jgi:hypothetical protein
MEPIKVKKLLNWNTSTEIKLYQMTLNLSFLSFSSGESNNEENVTTRDAI